MVYSRKKEIQNFRKKILFLIVQITVNTPQICANIRIVAEKTTKNTTHLSSK